MRRTAIAAALVLAAGSAAGQELPRSPITFVHDAQFDAGCEAFPNLLELGTECGGPTGRYAAEEDRGGATGWSKVARTEHVFGSPVAPFLDEVEREVRRERRYWTVDRSNKAGQALVVGLAAAFVGSAVELHDHGSGAALTAAAFTGAIGAILIDIDW